MNLGERIEYSRILNGLRKVRLVETHNILWHQSSPSNTDHKMSFLAGIWVLELLHQSFNLARKALFCVVDFPAPYFPLLEGLKIETSDDSEVVSATSKRNPEIGVLIFVGVDDVPRSENYFIIEDVIADESFATGEK